MCRIENRSLVLPVRFRQVEAEDDSWQLLMPGSSLPFTWEDLCHKRLLEVMVDGAETATARQINIDIEAEHNPTEVAGKPVAAVRIQVMREITGMMSVKIADWKPSDMLDQPQEMLALVAMGGTPSGQLGGESSSQSASMQQQQQQLLDAGSEKKFFVLLHLDEIGVSIVDHTPEELLYISMQAAFVSYDTTAGGASRYQVGEFSQGREHFKQIALQAVPIPVDCTFLS